MSRNPDLREALTCVGKFSLTLASRTNHRPLEDVVVSINLGQGASSVSATATGDKRSAGMGSNGLSGRSNDAVVEGHVGGGTWEFDPNASVSRSPDAIWSKADPLSCSSGR